MIRPVQLASLILLAAASNATAQCGLTPLTASDGIDGDQFGASVDVSGNTLVVGTPRQSDQGMNAGTVYVFTRSGSDWNEVQQLFAPDASPGDQFGSAVAVEGSTLAVGAPFDDDGCVGDPTCNSGAIWIFEHDGTSFMPTQKLGPGIANEDDFLGFNFSLDEGRLFTYLAGDILMFEAIGSTWVQTDALTSPLNNGETILGAFSVDGDRIAAAATGPSSGIQIFDLQGGSWVEGPFFTAFGSRISLSGDTVASSSLNPGSPQFLSKVRIYSFDGTSWAQEQEIVDGNDGDVFGILALEDDRLIVGAPRDDTNGTNSGAAYVYERAGGPGTWQQVSKFVPDDGVTQDEFAADIALEDGLAAFGARSLLAGVSPGPGRAYVLDLDGPAPTPQVYCTAKTASGGCLPSIATSGTPGLTSPSPFLVAATNVPDHKNGLLIYGINGPLNVPFFGGLLCVTPPLARTSIQTSGGALPCAGSFAFDFNALVQSGGTPITLGDFWTQYWFRDPQNPDGTGTGLSDAVAFTVCF